VQYLEGTALTYVWNWTYQGGPKKESHFQQPRSTCRVATSNGCYLQVFAGHDHDATLQELEVSAHNGYIV